MHHRKPKKTMTMTALSTEAALLVCCANVPRPDLFIHENGAWTIGLENPSCTVSTARASMRSSQTTPTNVVPLSVATSRQVCDASTSSPKAAILENEGLIGTEYESPPASDGSELWTFVPSAALH